MVREVHLLITFIILPFALWILFFILGFLRGLVSLFWVSGCAFCKTWAVQRILLEVFGMHYLIAVLGFNFVFYPIFNPEFVQSLMHLASLTISFALATINGPLTIIGRIFGLSWLIIGLTRGLHRLKNLIL